jgi:hypothetical protein
MEFTGQGEMLTPREELVHMLATYGSLEAMPGEVREKLAGDFGSEIDLENAVEEIHEEHKDLNAVE